MNKPHIRVVAAEIEQGGRYLITQRRPVAAMPLLWEFPGGKVEPGESDGDALARELLEKLALPIEVGARSGSLTHIYEEYTLDFVVYRARALGEPQALRVHDLRWVAPEDFDQYTFPGADKRSIDQLLQDED